MYQLTKWEPQGDKFIRSLAMRLDVKHPGDISIQHKKGEIAVFLSDNYWEQCQIYVACHCKIKDVRT